MKPPASTAPDEQPFRSDGADGGISCGLRPIQPEAPRAPLGRSVFGFPISRVPPFAVTVARVAGILILLCSSTLAGEAPSASHWAFQPLKNPVPPVPLASKIGKEAVHPIDLFLEQSLGVRGLHPNPPATKRELIRRVYLVLIGLPPAPEAVLAFERDGRPDAWERCVDSLLASPRYGERWAQHWLDVVRYADTHGFEVNTERPNAWPYRDYVIRAFNRDLPYDQFVREQLAGDSFGEDAALGFLVTAAALLPGQIGADDVSKRLARQDELSEVVANTGQVFLGLSIGCARCHNHKFDPISQRDYYAMQAFFAGVEYGERPMKTPNSDAQEKERQVLRTELERVQQELSRFELIAASPDQPRRVSHARTNGETFAAMDARFVRFTIHDANLHPTLGLIEPCLDELEILAADTTRRNVALSTAGAKVTASGSRTSDRHRLEHLNDGQYGNSRSWMSDEAGRGWVMIELPALTRIDTVVWSRDRLGEFTDRLPTSYVLEAGPDLEHMKRLSVVAPLRPSVNSRKTSDRFAPVETQRVRFIINACSSLEPCLDEVEIFTTGSSPRNIALATAGTMVKASSSLPGSSQHTLEHINDGLPGNDHSWISNELGKGWVEFTFAQSVWVDRVVWSRDREGKLEDRMVTDYRIEVEDLPGHWKAVAGSQDRRGRSENGKGTLGVFVPSLASDEATTATKLLEEKQGIDKRLATLGSQPVVFAGTSKMADATHVLYRGDPEQPREKVAPTTPEVLGPVSVDGESPEGIRRLALASWIADARNPLTARVLVNRVWQGHFGLGLVETPSDFGRSGARPSHPELLDWLASDFIRSGWSIKQLHRRILTSQAFRRSSSVQSEALRVDRDNRWLWRFSPRRMESEIIRDSMLAVSGRLGLKMGGRGFDLFKSRGGLDGFPPVEQFGEEGLRRMIYSHKVRMEREIVFGAFDCPDAGQSMPRRRQSTTPIQALNLLNSQFTLTESEALAQRLSRDAGPGASTARLIEQAYQLALGRPPDAAELGASEPIAREHGLAAVCRALFNSNEFLFIP